MEGEDSMEGGVKFVGSRFDEIRLDAHGRLDKLIEIKIFRL